MKFSKNSMKKIMQNQKLNYDQHQLFYLTSINLYPSISTCNFMFFGLAVAVEKFNYWDSTLKQQESAAAGKQQRRKAENVGVVMSCFMF